MFDYLCACLEKENAIRQEAKSNLYFQHSLCSCSISSSRWVPTAHCAAIVTSTAHNKH